MNNAKGGKVESCSRIKDGDRVRRIWKEYFKDQYNIDKEEVAVNMRGFDGIQRETTSEERHLEE